MFSVVVCSLVVLGLVAGISACGEGDELTLDEYFRQLEAAGGGANQRSAALQDEFEMRLRLPETAEEIIEATRQFYSGNASIFRDLSDNLEGVEPPTEVEEAHEGFVDATRVSAAVYENLSERAARAQSVPELQQLVAALDRRTVEAVFERVVDACLVLQGIADEIGIDVFLECEA
jgi:hypothetical protein